MRNRMGTFVIVTAVSLASLAVPAAAFAEPIEDLGRGGVPGCTTGTPPYQAACRKAQCPTGGC